MGYWCCVFIDLSINILNQALKLHIHVFIKRTAMHDFSSKKCLLYHYFMLNIVYMKRIKCVVVVSLIFVKEEESES